LSIPSGSSLLVNHLVSWIINSFVIVQLSIVLVCPFKLRLTGLLRKNVLCASFLNVPFCQKTVITAVNN
jgi:hypothetical protein